MKHIMLDLETLSTQPTAAILSIGACLFDRDGVKDNFTFYANVDPECYELRVSESYFHRSHDTMDWWRLPANAEAYSSLLPNRLIINRAIADFINWLPVDKQSYLIWSNGADFDLPVITHAMRWCDFKAPWSHKNTRCYRTVKNLFPFVPFVPIGTAHKADDDAKAQANHLISIAKEFYHAFSIDLLEESSIAGAYRDLYNMPRMHAV